MNTEAAVAKTPLELFQWVAPDYDPRTILSHFEKTLDFPDTKRRERLINEFLKFMFLRSKYGKGFIPLMGDVDDVWHEFILQTEEYEKFCLALPGKSFIHHNSVHLDQFSEGKDKKSVAMNLLEWLPNYYRHFGEFTPEAAECWMIVGFLREELKLSLEEINALAKKSLKNQ